MDNPPANAEDLRDLGWENTQEEGMATPSSILAWRIPWLEEPGGLCPLGHIETLATKAHSKIYVSFPSSFFFLKYLLRDLYFMELKKKFFLKSLLWPL